MVKHLPVDNLFQILLIAHLLILLIVTIVQMEVSSGAIQLKHANRYMIQHANLATQLLLAAYYLSIALASHVPLIFIGANQDLIACQLQIHLASTLLLYKLHVH
jgi:hypothetical protein